MEDWRPIETAPKDGTEILVFYPRWGDEVNVILPAEWDCGSGREWEATWYCHAYGHTGDGPTHWMPMPSIPRVFTDV